MDTTDVTSWVGTHIPETMLFVGGLLALFIAICYVKNKESIKYKFLMFLGLAFGIIMLCEAVMFYGEWRMTTLLFVAVAGFALVIRPFREVHFAVILALMVIVLAYIILGGLDRYMIADTVDMSFLAEGWPKIIIAFLCGAMIYTVFNFAEAIVKLVGKILNWWPLLLVLGLICIVEACTMYLDYGLILNYIDTEAMAS